MREILYGLPSAIASPANGAYPGMACFTPFIKLYGLWVLPVDRTNVMRTPVRARSVFPIPGFRTYKRTYEELCNERAVQVLRDCERLGTTMHVLYSGGIDSTCLLVSLLKNATPEQKKRIVVLLSQESISENPRFYEEHIRGKLAVGSSITFPELIGQDVYLLSAEHNDMVMGSDKIGALINRYGPTSVHQSYDRALLCELFADTFGDQALAERSLDIFEKIRDTAPIPIGTNLEFLWWVNFCIKWQACFYYILLFTPEMNVDKVTREYLDSRFISFYNTEAFQLWSMNNLDKRIKDTWKSYKWIVKDVIYEYTKDAEYRDHKTKRGSLLPLLGFNTPQRFISADTRFLADLSPEDYLQAENDFV